MLSINLNLRVYSTNILLGQRELVWLVSGWVVSLRMDWVWDAKNMDLCAAGARFCCLSEVSEAICCQVNTLHCTFEGVQVVPDESVTGKFVPLCFLAGEIICICLGRWLFVSIYMCCWIMDLYAYKSVAGSYLTVSGLEAMIGTYVSEINCDVTHNGTPDLSLPLF